MFEDSCWLVLLAILPLIFFVASMRERMKSMEKKLNTALEDYEVLRNHLRTAGIELTDPRYPLDDSE